MEPKEILNISGDITREMLCEKYLHFTAQFKTQDPKTFRLMEQAYKTLLQELIDKEQGSAGFKIVLCASILFVLCGWTYIWLSHSTGYVSMMFAFIGAYFLVDFLSGCAHIALDHLLYFKTPIVGSIARDFNFHHIVPTDLTYIRWSQVLKPVAVGLCPTFTLFGLCSYLMGFNFGVDLFFWTTCLAALGQPIHRLAHVEESSNRLIRWLQRHRIILPPEDHRRHHQNGEQTHFCIFSGLCNPLLDRIAPFFLKRFTVKDK